MPNSAIDRRFLNHLRKVYESDAEHMAFAASFPGSLALAAGTAGFRTIVPTLCKTTSNGIIRKLENTLRLT